MKKLTVLLAAVMAFAFSANAYAANFSDISEQPVKVQDSIAKTVALGIINGYEDGTFGPEQNITRAEFSKIAVTAAGAKDTADMLANNASSFKDVKAGQWYTGWVNASESLGIFQGDGNGNFRPNDTITNQEVITVLMRLLGYNDNLTGTWPVNYVTQANKSEILDDVAVVASAAAKRGDVVVMLDATLDTDLVTYDKDTNEFVAKQTGISASTTTGISLLQDSFKGSYEEVTGWNDTDNDGNWDAGEYAKTFNAVTQLKDADKHQLTWTVNGKTYIIDDETRVSYNGGSLFDLENHQGKVYYVTENDKKYVRFIDVESYTKTTTGTPVATGDSTAALANQIEVTGQKVKVDKTTYNSTVDVKSDLAATINSSSKYDATKNSNYVMYFNEDDQVYMVQSDKKYTDKVVFVKTVGTSTVKLIGEGTAASLTKSDDVLIYTEEGFITPDELEVGDALMQIGTGKDLFVKLDMTTGTLTKGTLAGKLTIGGSTYTGTVNTLMLDAEMEAADASIDDVYKNEVKYVLNKDNTVAAIVVDEVSTGTKLYGIVMGGDGSDGWGNNQTVSSISIFTEEGKTVTYGIASDVDVNGRALVTDSKTRAANDDGQLIEYKLNSDGEIKSYKVAGTGAVDLASQSDKKITVQNNAYLKYNVAGSATASISLASNVVVFEVDHDGSDIEVNIATRSSVLAQDDFTPDDVKDGSTVLVNKYAYGYKNSNEALRALAYTNTTNTTYYYGVIAEDILPSGDNDNAVYFLDDENEYDLDTTGITPKKNDFVVYRKSGDKVTILYTIANKTGLASAPEIVGENVKTYKDGVITFNTTSAKAFAFTDTNSEPLKATFSDANSDGKIVQSEASYTASNLVADGNWMTNDDTVVFVLGDDGKFVYGSTDDIASNDKVYVVIADEDGYADVLIVDNYNI